MAPAPTSPECHYGVAWTVFDYATLRLPRPTVLAAGRSLLLARAMKSFVVIPWPFYKQARQGGPKSGPESGPTCSSWEETTPPLRRPN